MPEKPNILIALLAYRERLTGATFKSITALTAALQSRNIGCSHVVANHTDIAWVRNATASAFLNDPKLTHLGFVDDDMAFMPSAFLRALEADKPLIGCLCPKRYIDINKALDLARAGHSNGNALAQAIGFASPPPANSSQKIAPVESIGMGVTLIHRRVFTTMIDKKCVNTYLGGGISGFDGAIYGFFDRMPGCGEDVSFCRRWREHCGGEVYAITDEDIGHVGEFTFRAKFSDLNST